MPSAIEPGAVIDGKYRVVRLIGEGGMGTVYEGENVRIERRVAIKVLHEHVASSPEFAQRFEREARASARIGSPHVCDVLDLGDLPNGERFIVMEYLDGESLEDRLERVKLSAVELAPIAFEILEGLGTMHQAGVVHRDLKPANVFLSRGRGKREVVKILDFGVAKIVPRADEPGEMTSTGMMMGTPLYMSPEQARGARDVDGRTDLYAASVIFYRALTGAMPHTALNLHELLFKIVLEDPRPILELAPDVDEAFAELVTRGLARDADQRYSSAREYQEEIAAWGATQGRASLAFAVTLSSEPPPLRPLSGGYPVALLQNHAPVTGPQLPSEPVGPPTPAFARTQASTSGAAPAAPAAKQSGGTPTAWADDAPEIAKRALAEMEAKRASAQLTGGRTQVIESRPRPSSESIEVPPPAVRTAPKSGARLAMAVGAAIVVAGAAVVGVATRVGGVTAGGPDSAAAANAPAASEPPPEPAAIAASATSRATGEPTDEPPPEPAPDTSAEVATPVATAKAAATSKATTAKTAATSKAATSKTAATSKAATSKATTAKTAAPVKSAAPSATASPTPTSSSRRFRTKLD